MNLAVRYHEFGDPTKVLQLEELPLPHPKGNEVLVEMLASTIHPSDLGLINGSYGKLRKLPAIGGREGVGKVIEVGSQADRKLVGRIVSMSESMGTWQTFTTINANELIFLPSLVPLEQLTVAILNPLTAWRILHDFEYLREGDFIIQNAGNSAVGEAVIQFSKLLGVSCISLVRTKERLLDLKKSGAELVLMDDDQVPEKVDEWTKGKKCVMALNSIGGRSALRLAKSICEGGIHLTFGAMDGSPIRFPTRELIFNDIRFLGFWLDRWKKRQTPEDLRKEIDRVLQLLALDQVRYSIDQTFELRQIQGAWARNQESRLGKVVIVPNSEDSKTNPR